jgi:hypothetical protein
MFPLGVGVMVGVYVDVGVDVKVFVGQFTQVVGVKVGVKVGTGGAAFHNRCSRVTFLVSKGPHVPQPDSFVPARYGVE